jgi:hypothetical protein
MTQVFSQQYTDKKEKNIFLIYKEIQRDRAQSHLWLKRPPHTWGNICPFPHVLRLKPFLIYDFAADSIWISLLYEENFVFFFITVRTTSTFLQRNLIQIHNIIFFVFWEQCKKYLSCVMSVSVHLPGRLSADGGKIIPLNIDRNQITNILSLIHKTIQYVGKIKAQCYTVFVQ